MDAQVRHPTQILQERLCGDRLDQPGSNKRVGADFERGEKGRQLCSDLLELTVFGSIYHYYFWFSCSFSFLF